MSWLISEQKYKVIAVDNLNRDYIDDKIVKDNLTNEEAIKIADEYNKSINNTWYYRVVKQDYPLLSFNP